VALATLVVHIQVHNLSIVQDSQAMLLPAQLDHLDIMICMALVHRLASLFPSASHKYWF